MTQPIACTLEAKLAVEPSALTIEWSVKSAEPSRIYVCDRPVRHRGGGRWVPDEEGPVRSLRDGGLRILFGNCPLPVHCSVTTHVLPQVSPVEGGGVHRGALRLPFPIVEHSTYWSARRFTELPPEAKPRAAVPMVFTTVDFIVEVVRDLEPEVAPVANEFGGVSLPASYHREPTRLRQTFTVAPMSGLRRFELDGRVLLPGEIPETLEQMAAGRTRTA